MAAKIPVMDAKLAHAVGTDAGNRSMHAAGRVVWSEEDYNAAADEYARVFPSEGEDEMERARR